VRKVSSRERICHLRQGVGLLMEIALIIVGLALNILLLTLIHRRGVGKQLPWFVCYVVWGAIEACTQLILWPLNRRLYGAIYWWMEGIAVVLIVGAVRESILRIFEGFTSRPLFRWALWTVIGAVVVYSAWKAVYAPPVQTNRLASFILGAEFAFRWGIAGIGLLTMVLMFFLAEPLGSREGSIVRGFGITSIAYLLWVLSRSLFGTRFLFLTKYLAPVGYFVAIALWIRAFWRPVQEFGFKELGMGPEEIAKELNRYQEFGERIMRDK